MFQRGEHEVPSLPAEICHWARVPHVVRGRSSNVAPVCDHVIRRCHTARPVEDISSPNPDITYQRFPLTLAILQHLTRNVYVVAPYLHRASLSETGLEGE